jgi:hypothetical protein
MVKIYTIQQHELHLSGEHWGAASYVSLQRCLQMDLGEDEIARQNRDCNSCVAKIRASPEGEVLATPRDVQLLHEKILSLNWISAGGGANFAGAAAFSPLATSFAIRISPSV